MTGQAEPGLVPGTGESSATLLSSLRSNPTTQAAVRIADIVQAVCVDVRPIINGPSLDQPGDENAPESMQGVADALLATGLPELE